MAPTMQAPRTLADAHQRFWARHLPLITQPQPLWIRLVLTFVGAFGGLAILQAVFGHASYFLQRGYPQIIASYGASAVLCFGIPESPLAQPRAVLGGHFVSGLTGIIVALIFNIHLPVDHHDAAPRLSWLAASLASAVAIVAMQLTKTTHPPAGATALLPIVDSTINRLRWNFLSAILLSSTLLVAVAMLTNNVIRRYPLFWWSPATTPTALPKKEEATSDVLPVTNVPVETAAR